MENIDKLKHSKLTNPKYILKNAKVFVSPHGFHYIDYLDPIENVSPEIEVADITNEEINYLENQLQSNSYKFDNQVKILKNRMNIKNSTIIDIGSGGGLFLSKLKDEGAKVMGIEIDNIRAYYASTNHKLEIIKNPIESNYWAKFKGYFDIVTLWDVIQHVNYPLSTLKSSVSVLKSGGYLFIDTPCRNSFYHKVGEITYRLSKGKFPTFLNSMYSAHKYGHKQIFSTWEMKNIFKNVGLQDIEVKKFHELSFPLSHYLKIMLKYKFMVKLFSPIVYILLTIFPIKNKMLVIGRKRNF